MTRNSLTLFNQLRPHTVGFENAFEGTLYKGISKRQFTRTFTIADDVEVLGAELKDGLLKVSLEKIIPEAKKPRSITIK